MADDPLTYLLDRFATDATTLRARADHLAGRKAPEHGPDAAASIRMAEACEDVLALLNNLSVTAPDNVLDALEGLGPELHALSERATDAFVRSVYGGAATRISDVVQKSRSDEIEHDDDHDDAMVDENDGDDLDDDIDDDIDDDDIDDVHGDDDDER